MVTLLKRINLILIRQLKTRTDVATEQEKFLRQNENDISELQEQLKNYTKINEEATELKIKNEEKEMAIKSKEQSNLINQLRQADSFKNLTSICQLSRT